MIAKESQNNPAKDSAEKRLYDLLELQKRMEVEFGTDQYNVFVFGSYVTTRYVDGESDIDIAIYTEKFDLYKRLALYLEKYFELKQVPADIFYIDTTMAAPVYCAPLKSQIQFTDYYPEKLVDFEKECREILEQNKARMVG